MAAIVGGGGATRPSRQLTEMGGANPDELSPI
jgi:hypothetical protein